MSRNLKFISICVGAAIVAIIVVVAALSLNASPHFAFPSYQQVNSASGSSFTGQKSGNAYSNGSAPGTGVVKVETMNYTSGRTFLELGIILYKSSSDAVSGYTSVNTSIARIVVSLPNTTAAHSQFRGYAYAYVITPHNVTIFGVTVHFGFSFAVCRLGTYVFVIYTNFSGMSAGRMTGLIDLQINTMTGTAL